MPINWLVVLGHLRVSVALPILAGALGSAQRSQGFSPGNLSWILMCSFPISILCVLVTRVFCWLDKSDEIERRVFCGCTALTIVLATLFSFWFLDQVSGL